MSNTTKNIKVRFAPSPTGLMHIGNIRAFLFNYLLAQKSDGEIYMRFEDTDKERSKKEFEDVALYALKALGISFDHGPYRQSERGELYTEAITKLIKSGHAYEGEESKDGSGDKVIRFKNPNKKITFTDSVRGEITIDTTDFGDFVIARSLENPLYHLTVVVDDIGMGITDIIRGEDHITSTPRQILLIQALEGALPRYTHLPLIVGDDNKKLSKRHGAITYQEFEKQGYLPEAIINHLALLGWSSGDDREYFTITELVSEFTLAGIHKSPAKFSYDKLDSINRHYLLQLDDDVLVKNISERLTEDVSNFLQDTTDEVRHVIFNTIFKERLSKWSDVESICSTELSWLGGALALDSAKMVWKKSTAEDTKKHLHLVIGLLSAVSDDDWAKATDAKSDDNAIKNAIWEYASEVGRGDVLWPMRYSLTGQERSPDPFIVAFILGKKEVLKRLQYAVSQL